TFLFVFFFQAEDGIRDYKVTGVQTCALPIYHFTVQMARGAAGGLDQTRFAAQKTFLVRVENRDERNFRQIQSFTQQIDADEHVRSEERRVGKECRSRGWRDE